jgi:hypothetical protein
LRHRFVWRAGNSCGVRVANCRARMLALSRNGAALARPLMRPMRARRVRAQFCSACERGKGTPQAAVVPKMTAHAARLNAPLSTLESPTVPRAAAVSFGVAAPGGRRLPHGGERSESRYQQTAQFLLPLDGCAVTAIVAASGYAVSRSNSARARSVPSCATDPCTPTHGLSRVKS